MWTWKYWWRASRIVCARSVAALLLIPVCLADMRVKPAGKDAAELPPTAAPVENRPVQMSPGSLYDSGGALGNLSRDMRAAQLNDIVTIEISDKASALSKGATTSGRKSQAKATISALAGPLKATSPLSSLADLTGQTKLDGQGST